MSVKNDPKFHKLIKKLVKRQKNDALRGMIEGLNPVEIANALVQLKPKHQVAVLEVIGTERASEVLSSLDSSPVLQELVRQLQADTVTDLVEEMSRDDAADFVSALEDDQADAVLEGLSREDRDEITNLLQYNEESAGGIMDPHVVTVTRQQTVTQAVASIKAYTEEKDIDSFYTVYVVDEFRHLIGTIDATQLVLADGPDIIKDVMNPDVVAVDVDTDQEEVARIAREYDLVVVPVIDKHLHLIGRVTIDDIVDVLSDEFEEDIAHFAGTGDEEVLDTSIVKSIRDRLPWLLLALLGGALAAVAMNFYEGPLAEMPQVAYFVPLIAAMGGNIGIQSSSIVVRGLATGEIHANDLIHRLWKELRVAFLNGLICSVCLLFLAWLITDSLIFGVSSSMSLLLVVIMAAATGASVPIMLKRINVDPALATGPFITTANDVLGVIIYLLIAFNIPKIASALGF